MKKYISILLVILLVLTGFQLSFALGENDAFENDSQTNTGSCGSRSGERGKTLYVGSGQTYTKIQDAIDNANAGDTVIVYPGTYEENIIINKKLSLKGNGSVDTIIMSLSNVEVVKITSNWVNVNGFKITVKSKSLINDGINLDNVQYCNISYNRIIKNTYGISIYNSSNNTITNNIITSNNGGIHIEGLSKNNWIENNNISSNKKLGIFIDTSPSGLGLAGVNDDNDYYIDVNLYYNSTSNSYQYRFPGDGKFTPGVVNETAGKRVGGDIIIIDDGARPSTWDSGDTIVRDPLNEGDLPYGFDDQIMNYYNNPGTPGRINFTAPLIDEELVQNYSQSLTEWADDDGDWDSASHDVGMDGQPGTNDVGEGDGRPTPGEPYVDEDVKFNGTINNIPVSNIIVNNTISHNSFGIYLESTSKNLLRQNTINYNGQGIFCFYSNQNYFYHNDLIENTQQAYDNGKNIWNTSDKGNFWSDWTSPDNDNDGIVDDPYKISGNIDAKDYFPLVKPYKNYLIEPPSTKIFLNSSYSNSTSENVFFTIHKASLTAVVKGQLNGSITSTNPELIIINSGSFAGKGFFSATWTATLEGISYTGSWQGMLFRNPGNTTIFLKGTLNGKLHGITEGYLTESKSGSGVFDLYSSNWTISYLGYKIIYAKLVLDGKITYQSSKNLSSKIDIFQASYKGIATGYYNKSINIVINHVRINKSSNQYHGQGFSIITYISTFGSGMGWTYDRIISNKIINITGFFSKPILGIAIGKLYYTTTNKALSLSIIKIDSGLPPRAVISLELWGQNRVSPGETVNYFLEYTNSGQKSAMFVKLVVSLPKNVQYISNTGNGTYYSLTHEISWLIDITAKTKGLVSVRCKINWGLSQGKKLMFNGSATDFKNQKLLDSCSFTSIVRVAKDPNMKYGPDGNITIGKRLNYRIEFENEGTGTAYGVYFFDELSRFLDESSLQIGPVYSTQDNSKIASAGNYEPETRTIKWSVGEVGPKKGGYTNISIEMRDNLPIGTVILNYATVIFPSVPEVTRTNGIVSIVKLNQGPIANAGGNKVGTIAEEINFDGSGSTDPEKDILSFKWDFGDGSSTDWQSSSKASHKYLNSGNFTVTLTVSDGEFKDNESTEVLIINEITNRSPKIKDIPTIFVHYYSLSQAKEYPGYGYDFSYFISDPDNNRSELTLMVIPVDQKLFNFIKQDPINNMRVIFKLPIDIVDGKSQPMFLYVSDPLKNEAYKLFNITVIIDTWPVELIKSIDDQSFDEDGKMDDAFYLYSYFEDKDGGTTFEIITNENSKIIAMIDPDNYVDFAASEKNWNGFEEMIILAKDSVPEQYVYGVFMVYVNPVNDPPSIVGFPEIVVNVSEKKTLNLKEYIFDPDTNFSELVIKTSDYENTWINESELCIQFNKEGEYKIILTVFDGENEVSNELKITVVNLTPKPDSKIDSDGDNLPNAWEILYGLDPNNASDAQLDIDGDSLTNLDEYYLGTDPTNWDTDGDGISDSEDEQPLIPQKNGEQSHENVWDFLTILIFAVISILILIIMVGTLITFRKRSIKRTDMDQKQDLDDELYGKTLEEIIFENKDSELTEHEIRELLDQRFQNGELSEETYYSMKNFIDNPANYTYEHEK